MLPSLQAPLEAVSSFSLLSEDGWPSFVGCVFVSIFGWDSTGCSSTRLSNSKISRLMSSLISVIIGKF